MYHPVLYKYAEIKAARFFKGLPFNHNEHIKEARQVILDSFENPIAIDGVNWWSMKDALNRVLDTNFDEDTFSDVCEQEDWDWSNDTQDLRDVLEEVTKFVDMSHKQLEDYL